MSDRISNQLANVEAQLKTISPHVPNAATNPAQSLSHAPSLTGTRHDTLYLEDGNLIIAAPISTGKTMLFRVHQSMLSLQSPVFAAMFTLPHPAANRDLYDGAPFVHMPDDAEYIESLLKVLYNPSALPYKRLDPLTPLNVGPTLAMATKYEMDSLRNRIVTQLEADWPGSLPEWDRLETEVAGFTKEHTNETNLKVDDLYLDERLPEPCAAIRLAMDMNIPKILPSAMYHLSRLSIHDDWLEARKDDRASLGLDRTARWDLLEVSDFKLLLKLRETISEVHFRSLYNPPAKSCRTPEGCAEMWNKACCKWEQTDDHLEEMRKLANARSTQGLCRLCWSEARSSFSEKRVELWDDICECIEEHTRGQ
ncbi:hypothetical protein GGX14DRAFT_345544 [Mycena pura]|uniref:BTB domain-containing protein n=1 Tax=Mycena pura TaxID=153505 RepID=A0AAD6YSP9_9AGAR|nr:hypothetical protein GGX14DRAFT_345544 [Mycena pura]